MRQEHEHKDVLIVGAGISGVSAAYHLMTECPEKSFAILEGRPRMGGTWDLFQYPGIRSDSDMYTLGYRFRPWTEPEAIAKGPAILSYVKKTAEEHGIDKTIRFGQKVVRATFSTDAARWTVETRDEATGKTRTLTCAFLFGCTGYFDYEGGHAPEFPGQERFEGRVVHPQKWGPGVDYEGKRVVVIGSGATAVTLVPELAKKAAHVTMLQRSPTYLVSMAGKDSVADAMRGRVPVKTAYAITRWKNVLLGMGVYQMCQRLPKLAAKLLLDRVRDEVGDGVDIEKHFTPRYKPWDQRMCLVPDGDFFEALRGGRASVVTDRIATFTDKGIRLESGEELEADLVVTATGLKLQFLGGIEVNVDGKRVLASETLSYTGMMCSDVPNLAMVVGYSNASWTLRADLIAAYVCRLLKHMDRHGYAVCVPRVDASFAPPAPLFNLASGYVLRDADKLPRQSVLPWRHFHNYVVDLLWLRYGSLEDRAMRFLPYRRSASASDEKVHRTRPSVMVGP